MADLFLGQTCTEAYRFISNGAAKTFQFSFQPDKVELTNLTGWKFTQSLCIFTWRRDQTLPGRAWSQRVIADNGTTGQKNFNETTTGGFTVADTQAGVPAFRALISGVTQADPCVVTTSAAHGYQSDQIVRITDLGAIGPGIASRGMDPLNNNRFLITVLSATTFSLRDVITDEPIDSTSFPAWISGGRCDIETRVLTLNNPQVDPYSAVKPYNPNPFIYDPETYRLTAGTPIMGSNGDICVLEVYKWGKFVDLGQLT
jgi:hypothetical protein